MSKPLQLGTITLRPTEPRVGPSRIWAATSATFLETTPWDSESEQAAEILLQNMNDSALHMTLQRRDADNGTVAVRVRLVPNDHRKWAASSHRIKRLRQLFHLLHQDWEGGGPGVLESPPEDLGSGMQTLYALIESPPEPSFGPSQFVRDDEVFDGLRAYANPRGVRTAMYSYQIRSVARMLQMETSPRAIVDPSFSGFTESGTGDIYYVNLTSYDIQRTPLRYPLARGGILCEQMGVGKTLMCLALVLVSRHQHTCPPEGWDVSDVVTDEAVRTYSTPDAAALRTALGLGEDPALGPWSDDELVGTPSLASMCADIVARVYPTASREEVIPPSAVALLERQCVFYRFPPPVRLPRGAKLVPHVPAQRLVLAATTLVIVPPILVPQWVSEATKHLEPDALNILVIPEGKAELPPLDQLITYDVVLMSLDRFRREGHHEEGQPLSTELLGARWKRIILDEGNIANNTRSDAMLLARSLSIERRWIVSGTPTVNLKQGTETATKAFLKSESMQRVDSSAESRSGLRTETPFSTCTPATRPSKWSRADENDLARLGSMLAGFLASEIFQPQEFRRWVKRPLCDKMGPERGAVERIRHIMSSVMVKHRPGVIDTEVAIPASSLNAEMVHFSHWQRLTYNALTGLVAANVFTSEGEDVDFLLHPRNVESLNQVVLNLHLATLWFTSQDMDLQGAIARTQSHLDNRKTTPEQRERLEEALLHMRAAADDSPAWAEWMSNGSASLPYTAGDLPWAVRDSWSDAPDHDSTLVDAHSLSLLRSLNVRGAAPNDVARAGWDERAKRPHAEALIRMMERAEKQWRAGERARDPELPAHRKDNKAAADKPKAPKVARNRPTRASKETAGQDLDVRLAAAERNAMRTQSSALQRPLPCVVQTTSASSKVNWVVRAVLASPPTDKFVVFATREETAHLTEAFDLVGISSVYAGNKVAPAARNRAIDEFKQTTVRVCLLEVKLGGRGLDLTVANRMIFLSPVWNLDVQAQAIKRIHRIGQTRPSQIAILVTEGTFEEDIVRRESSSRSSEEEKRYSRTLVEKPRFVYAESPDEASYPISLVPTGTASDAEEAAYVAAAKAVISPSHAARPKTHASHSGALEARQEGRSSVAVSCNSATSRGTVCGTEPTPETLSEEPAALSPSGIKASNKRSELEDLADQRIRPPVKRIRFAD